MSRQRRRTVSGGPRSAMTVIGRRVIRPSRCGTGRSTQAGGKAAPPRSESESRHGPRHHGPSHGTVRVGPSDPAPRYEPGGARRSRSRVPSRLGARAALVPVVASPIPLLSLNNTNQLPRAMQSSQTWSTVQRAANHTERSRGAEHQKQRV